MSAKHSKKTGRKTSPAEPAKPGATEAGPAGALAGSAASATDGASTTEGFTPWIQSSDPRRRTIGKIVLTGVWIYVAALWLLALDQTFHWGIFGPTVPPVP